jgi:outer membrane protein assembly factor BamE (lipoprotein component of BamABCDE complex)
MSSMHTENYMRRGLELAIFALALALVPACYMTRSTVNAPIDRAQVDKLVPGTSSARDAVAILGAPSEVVQLGLRTAYRYEFTASKRGVLFLVVLGFYNEDTRSDRVWLFFDANDVLTHMGTTLEAADTEYALPWYDVYEKK